MIGAPKRVLDTSAVVLGPATIERLTQDVSWETISFWLLSIEHCRTKEGIGGEGTVIAWSERAALTPATESLSTIYTRTVSTGSLCRKGPPSVG